HAEPILGILIRMLLSSLLLATVAQSRDPQIESLIRRMTQEEKLTMIGGGGFNIKANKRLKLAGPGFTDGPVGTRNFGPTTAYPAGTTLAATWNPALARQFGESMARDALARGTQVILGPGVNLSRIPQNGRNFEYLGEDPKLCADTAVQIIEGMQSKGIAACVKHFAGNEHEDDRNKDSTEVDERTLRELYFRPFEAAVKEANVASVMCSYNLLNGTYTSANRWLLTDVLRKDWGFKGFTMTDWGAAHDAKGVFTSGMDLEMPVGDYMNSRNLTPMLREGTISKYELDDKVRHMLVVMKRFGWLRSLPKATGPKNSDQNHKVALQIAREGTVLLKNNGVLPLDKSIKHVLVVGDNASPAMTGGGGSSFTTPIRKVSLLEAIEQEFKGKAEVQFIDTSKRLIKAFEVTKWDSAGYSLEAFAGRNLEGEPIYKATLPSLINDWNDGGVAPGKPKDDFSVRLTGKFTAPVTDKYYLVYSNDDGLRLWLDGKLVVDDWKDQGATVKSAEIEMTAGQTYDIKVEFYENAGAAVEKVGFLP
ncbi:MAG: glycoside hydrolase family 3 N-terminal domain-containing protein, partial [Armatimonadota bacterium]